MGPPKPALGHVTKNMTANPAKPVRYRPGKAVAPAEQSSSDEEDSEAEATEQKQEERAPPKAASFVAAKATKQQGSTLTNLKSLNLGERRRQDAIKEQERIRRERAEHDRLTREAGFVTESEESGSGEGESSEEDQGFDDVIKHGAPAKARAPARPAPARPSGSTSEDDSDDSGSEEDSSDSDSAPARKFVRPLFIKKENRGKTPAPADVAAATPDDEEAAKAEAETARRREANDAMIQDQIDRDSALKATGHRDWDEIEGDGLDDTDGLDPELEHREWVARELARLKRARQALEEREAEIAEVERRRGLTTPEREAEDDATLAEQKAAKDAKGKAGFMARYHHRGAFFIDSEDVEGQKLAERDLMGAEYENQVKLKEALPEYLQVRDQTMIGRKGRQRHRDLRNEDTGRWGDDGARGGRGGRPGGGRPDGGAGAASGPSDFGLDERFRPDGFGGGGGGGHDRGATGANASALGSSSRKRPGSPLAASRPGPGAARDDA